MSETVLRVCDFCKRPANNHNVNPQNHYGQVTITNDPVYLGAEFFTNATEHICRDCLFEALFKYASKKEKERLERKEMDKVNYEKNA